MAGIFQQFLKGAAEGFFGSPYLKDYTHASKIFRSAGYQNAPKFKWLFHVYFKINKEFITKYDLENVFPSTANYGLMVKSIELPKFDVKVEEMNQYNRKRYVQTKINYQPIRINFHDDNAGQIKRLWEAYYRYYYYDSAQPAGFSRNVPDVDNASRILNSNYTYENEIPPELGSWGYSGDASPGFETTGLKAPFFDSIRIYGFNQHNFALYVISNPIIESFAHDTYSYNEPTGIMENNMTLRYESVKYYDGALNGQSPESIVSGFGNPSMYDTELSPISRPGNNRSIMGKGGLVDAGQGILGDLQSGNVLGAIQKAGRLSRTFKSGKDIIQAAKTELLDGVKSIVTNPENIRAVVTPINGALSGPVSQVTNSAVNKVKSLVTKPPTIPTDTP